MHSVYSSYIKNTEYLETMSLAAFSVLVVAFLLITGEASVIPSRSPASASPSFDSTGNPSSSFHTTTTNLLTGSIPSTNNDQEKSRDTRIPRLRINQVEQNWPEGLKEWSDEAFAEWCYADVDDIFDDEDESFRTNREKVAEKKLR